MISFILSFLLKLRVLFFWFSQNFFFRVNDPRKKKGHFLFLVGWVGGGGFVGVCQGQVVRAHC